MSDAAIAVARGCDYTNAGTVEFLYEDGNFYYLEMNTRLQVEHPVSELVADIDLVEQQLRVAAGEALSFSRKTSFRGHSIEIRINAEDPAEGRSFHRRERLPSCIPRWLRRPIRYGVQTGDTISQFYDNLIGKLIVWAHDRPTAIRRAVRALDELQITGVATTIPADRAILTAPEFGAATHSTNWVETGLDLTGVRSTIDTPDDAPRRASCELLYRSRSTGNAMRSPHGFRARRGAKRRRTVGASSSGGGGGSGQITCRCKGRSCRSRSRSEIR